MSSRGRRTRHRLPPARRPGPDCARTALRCGASSVKLVYRRSREEMPAIAEEIDAAEFEGVRLVLQRQPVGFVGNGNVTSVVLAEVEPGPPDASGRRRPVVTDRTSLLECDTVLLALGQSTAMDWLPEGWEVRGGRAWHGETPLAVWFAGDCVNGEGTEAVRLATRAPPSSTAGVSPKTCAARSPDRASSSPSSQVTA